MQRAYLSAFIVKIPFSLETLSLGRPAIPQFLMTTGSPIVLTRVKSSAVGMFPSRHPSTHFSTSFSRYCPVKAPKYEMHAQLMNTFPTSYSISAWITSTVCYQRTPSSASKTTSFSGLPILFVDLSISNSSASFSSCIYWHSASSFSTLSLMTWTASSLTLSSSYRILRDAVTSACLAFFGATFLVTI